MLTFLYILALLVLPAAPTQCVVGNLKENPTVYQSSLNFRCVLRIKRPKDTDCSDAVFFGDITFLGENNEVPCETYLDQKENIEHKCVCSGSCVDLFEKKIILSKTQRNTNLCMNSAKRIVVPLVTELLGGDIKLHMTCTLSAALVTMAFLFYFFS